MKARLLHVTLVAVIFALGIAGTASAATSGTTTATVTVREASCRSPSRPTRATSAPGRTALAGGTISGVLGQVQVLDARSAAAGSGWVATVISSAFTPPAGPAIAASAVSYDAGAITKIGTATYTANDPATSPPSHAAVTATGITGDNSATWNPTITVFVPGGMAAGVYSATITHSVV